MPTTVTREYAVGDVIEEDNYRLLKVVMVGKELLGCRSQDTVEIVMITIEDITAHYVKQEIKPFYTHPIADFMEPAMFPEVSIETKLLHEARMKIINMTKEIMQLKAENEEMKTLLAKVHEAALWGAALKSEYYLREELNKIKDMTAHWSKEVE